MIRKRVGVIAGGTSGIGLATARALGADGAALAITGRSLRQDDPLVLSLREELGTDVIGLDFDTTDRTGAAKTVDAVIARYGRIDVLVNCIGSAPAGSIEEVRTEALQMAFGSKVIGAISLMQHAIPHMKAQASGSIVNVAGSAGREPDPWMLAAGIVNAALLAASKAAATELIPLGITVNAVSPGPVSTTRWSGLVASYGNRNQLSFEEAEVRLRKEMPSGRPSTPEEVAALIAFLSSPQAAHISGTNITIDGGSSRSI